MYRSQLRLDIGDPSVRRGLADCNDMHRNLMKAFAIEENGGTSPRKELSILYRLVTINGHPSLYVISSECPDWSKVKGTEPLSEPMSIDGLKERFVSGSCFRFSLLASPTKKVRREGKLSSRVFLRDPRERMDWLERHARRNGFIVRSVRELSQEHISGRKGADKINYSGVAFDGILEITDPEAFWQVYCGGIGPGKSYGLGMLMIARI